MNGMVGLMVGIGIGGVVGSLFTWWFLSASRTETPEIEPATTEEAPDLSASRRHAE